MADEQFLEFFELEEFSSDWDDLGLDVEHDLWDLQTLIMNAPANAPVVKGTNGLRKLRFAPRGWKVGKSGAVRVCYVFFQRFGIVLLVMAYRKNEKDNLTATQSRAIASYIRRAEKWLERRMQ